VRVFLLTSLISMVVSTRHLSSSLKNNAAAISCLAPSSNGTRLLFVSNDRIVPTLLSILVALLQRSNTCSTKYPQMAFEGLSSSDSNTSATSLVSRYSLSIDFTLFCILPSSNRMVLPLLLVIATTAATGAVAVFTTASIEILPLVVLSLLLLLLLLLFSGSPPLLGLSMWVDRTDPFSCSTTTDASCEPLCCCCFLTS